MKPAFTTLLCLLAASALAQSTDTQTESITGFDEASQRSDTQTVVLTHFDDEQSQLTVRSGAMPLVQLVADINGKLADRFAALEARFADFDTQQGAQNSRATDVARSISLAESQIGDLQKKLKKRTSEIEALHLQNNALISLVSDLEVTTAKQQLEIDALRENDDRALSQRVDALESLSETRKTKDNSLQSQIDALTQNDDSALTARVAALETLAANLGSDNTHLQAQIDAIPIQVDTSSTPACPVITLHGNVRVVNQDENNAADMCGNIAIGHQDFATIKGSHNLVLGNNNDVRGVNSIVVGTNNVVSAGTRFSSILGGENNAVSANNAVILSGSGNQVSGEFSVIGGGKQNSVSGASSGVFVGENNRVTGKKSAVVAGEGDHAHGESLVAGATRNNSVFGQSNAVLILLIGVGFGVVIAYFTPRFSTRRKSI